MILIISRKFVAERLSAFARAEAKSWRLQIRRYSRGGNSRDTMTDYSGHGLISTANEFEDIREVETVVMRWLITVGTD